MQLEERIVELGREKDIAALSAYVNKLGIKQVTAIITKICRYQTAPEILTFLFQATHYGGASEITSFRVCKQVLQQLQIQDISTIQTNALLTLLIIEFEHLESKELMKLTEWCTECIQQPTDRVCWKDVLPKLLHLLKQKERVEYEGVEMTGADYKDKIINSLCMAKWRPEVISPLAAMFLDVLLSPDQHLQIVYKICKCMTEMPPNMVPPVVNQLLWLCEDQHGLPLFLELQNYFTTLLYSMKHFKEKSDKSKDMELMSDDIANDAVDIRDIQRSESTVLFHISQAAAGGHSIVKELIKSLKNVRNAPEFVLNPFLVAVLLCVSSISSYEDQAFDILKLAVIRASTEEEKRNSSAWLRDIVPKVLSIQLVFTKVIESSIRERDRVISGLIKFSFVLLSVTKMKSMEGKPDKIWTLARYILVTVAKKQPDVTTEIVQQLLQQILDHKNIQYISCLRKLCAEARIGMADSVSGIIQLLDNLGFLPEKIATELIRAILPLLRDSSSLRTTLTIILRKSMYSRNVETRKMAVSGLLLFLKHMDVKSLVALSQTSCSQGDTDSMGLGSLSQVDVHQEVGSLGNEATCIELLNILRRCFMQQSSVRLCLYQGLHDAVCKNPVLFPHALELLSEHFSQYYEKSENVLPPVNFSKIIEVKGASVILKEPLANLLFVIQQLTVKALSNSENSKQTADKLQQMLESLTDRMIKCSLEDLGFDNTTNFADIIPESQQAVEIFHQTLGIYEALMAYTISLWKETSSNCQRLSNLFKGYHRLIEFAKSACKPRKKDKDADSLKGKLAGKPLKLPSTLMDFETVNKLQALLSRSLGPASVEEVESLKNRREFYQHAMTTSLQLIQQAKQLKAENMHVNIDLYRHCTTLARVLYENCISQVITFNDFDNLTCNISAECFSEIVSLITVYYKSYIPHFLEEISNVSKSEGLGKQLYGVIEKLQETLKEIVNTDEQEQHEKIIELLVSTFETLASEIPFDSEYCTKIYEWAKELCQETTTENVKIAKSILLLLFRLFILYKSAGSIFGHISLHLLSIYGATEEATAGKDKFTRFGVLTDNSKDAALIAFCNVLRISLSDINWVVERLQSEYTARAYSSEYSIESRQEFLKSKERDVCCHVSHYVTVINNLTKMAVPAGNSSATLFRLLTSLYTTLITLTKYFCIRSSKLDPAFQTARFTQVITLAGRHLARNYDALISHVEEMEGEEGGKKNKKANNFALKSKVLKGAKSRTSLLFEREQFEQLIIKLSSKTKVNLMQYVKQNASRDFHISSKKLCKALDQQHKDGDNDTSVTTADDSRRDGDDGIPVSAAEERHPPTKKQRTK
ncbi:Fanconi anemia group I protein-like [Schistocerca serialis cubense]|uniref:Fanconi anemia group I protein-like n=1 Tax=Schistocerca serialis cubense TaxID=2023355 RepID=UPI00214E118D|nr:Fanconi anemia group I protein-like [Schistocerca serialis cubense]